MAAGLARDSVKAKQIKSGAVRSDEVQDDALTGGDILESSLVGVAPSGAAGGDLTGTYPNPTIGPNAVSSAEVAPDSLTAADLAPDSVDTSEIAANAVNQAEIATDGVGPLELAVDSVSADELDTISEVSVTVSVPANTNGNAIVACPAGTEVISGGGFTGSFTLMDLVTTIRSGNGWRVEARNETGAALPLVVRAYCLAA